MITVIVKIIFVIAVICYMCNMCMCGHKGYEFSAGLVIYNVSILAILVLNRVWLLHSSLQLGTVFKKKLLFHHYR